MNKRKVTCFLSLLCLVTLVTPNVNLAKAKSSKSAPGSVIFVMAEMPEVTATTAKHITRNDDIIYLDIKIPKVHGLSDKKFERTINKYLMKEGVNKERYVVNEAETYNKPNVDSQIPTVKFEYLSDYTVINAPNPYFVIETLDYQYSGGAHGISYQNYLVIDTNQNRIVALSDLFEGYINYEAFINEEINRQINERMAKGEFFFTGSDRFKGIKPNQPFYINQAGDLVIVFNVYEIAPYAAGVVEFPISKEKIDSLIK